MSRPSRTALRIAAVTAPLVGLLAAPLAAYADDAPGHARPLGVVNSLLIFLVAPVGFFLFVAVLTLRPGSTPKAQRYRPGRGWSAAPAWTGLQPAPTEGDDGEVHTGHAALPGGTPAMPVMEDAPVQEHADSLAEHAAHEDGSAAPGTGDATPEPPAESGGARGSW